MSKFIWILVLILLSGCATTKPPKAVYDEPDLSETVETVKIDYPLLQKNLKLQRDIRQLGYTDKSFYTCQAGAGFSSTKDCHTAFLVVIHVHLLCRDSEGTVEYTLDPSQITAISGRAVKWNMLNDSGTVYTDDEGFTQIVTVADRATRNQRLKLTVGGDFLYMKAGEIKKVVAPQSWCNP